MAQRVVVVGGGIAGLCSAVYLARAGCSVTLFERRRHLGGRAVTHLRNGYRFNIGARAVNRRGGAMQVYRELGVPVRGGKLGMPTLALGDGGLEVFPHSLWSTMVTPMLSAREKAQLARIVVSLRSSKGVGPGDIPVSRWLDERAQSESLRRVLRTFIGMATYTIDETQSAAAAVPQLAIFLRGQTVVDEGWQRLVDALHNQAVSAGITFVTSSRIVRVVHDEAVHGLELGELEDVASGTEAITLGGGVSLQPSGTMLPADHVVLAVDPITAIHLVSDELVTRGWRPPSSVQVASLDVALRSLPNPEHIHVAGVDSPLLIAAHSEFAHLAPGGGAMLHAMKLGPSSERELEELLDELQPGWRDVLVHKRFLPSLVVANGLITESWRRPAVATTIRGLYLAGDWVGDEGLLSDAAALSARAAARSILAKPAKDR